MNTWLVEHILFREQPKIQANLKVRSSREFDKNEVSAKSKAVIQSFSQEF